MHLVFELVCGHIIPEPVIAHFTNDYVRNGEGGLCC
jgi:hypothetical protein